MTLSPARTGLEHAVLFRVDSRRCALDARSVEEVLAAVAVRPLPGQPRYVAGVIDLRGTIVPVLDLRVRFGGTARPMELDDRLIVTRAHGRRLAIWVDSVDDFIPAGSAFVAAGGLVTGDVSLAGVASTPDGLTTIHNVAAFVAQCEADAVFATVSA
jgi:purine-binding chemotaxis protein CheW